MTEASQPSSQDAPESQDELAEEDLGVESPSAEDEAAPLGADAAVKNNVSPEGSGFRG